MHGADLSGAQLQGACLKRTQLQGANLSSAQLAGVSSSVEYGDYITKGFLDRIMEASDKESDLSQIIFAGGLNQGDVDSIIRDLPDEKAEEVRKKLEPHIGKQQIYKPPKTAVSSPGTIRGKMPQNGYRIPILGEVERSSSRRRRKKCLPITKKPCQKHLGATADAHPHWLTRDEDLRTASRVPYRLLEEAPDLSAGEPDAGNMLIQGDNLEALKALLPFYAGRVKCIYIDPPYNTHSAFEHYDDSLEHTQWLAMIWRASNSCTTCWPKTVQSGCPLTILKPITLKSSWMRYSEEETCS